MKRSNWIAVSAVVAIGFISGSSAYSAQSAQKTKRKPSSISEISEDPSSNSKYKLRVAWDEADTSTPTGKEKVTAKIEAASNVACVNKMLNYVRINSNLSAGELGGIEAARNGLLKAKGIESVLLVLKFSSMSGNVQFSFQFSCDASAASNDSSALCPPTYNMTMSVCGWERDVVNAFYMATQSVGQFHQLNEEKKNVKKNMDDFGSAQPEQDGNSDRSM